MATSEELLGWRSGTPRSGQRSPTDSRSKAAMENEALSSVLQVTLTGPTQTPIPTYLDSLANELKEEGSEPLLSKTLLERVLMERLSFLPPAETDSPLLYLVNSYRRALEESRKASSLRDKDLAAQLQDALSFTRELLVSYSGLMLLHPDMFAQPVNSSARNNSSSLLKIMLGDQSSSGLFGGGPSLIGYGLPAGFLEELIKRFGGEGLDEILGPVFEQLAASVNKMSLLAAFETPLRVLVKLVEQPAAAKVLVNHKNWIPASNAGRAIEMFSILGPFFRISCLEDLFGSGDPDPMELCFMVDEVKPSPSKHREIANSQLSLRTSMHTLHTALAEVMLALLRNSETRDKALDFLGTAVELNKGRSKMQIDNYAAGHGFFVNICAVLLKLCEPFLDPTSNKKDRIDPAYVVHNVRLDYSEETALAASSEDRAHWVDSGNHARTEGFRQLEHQKEQEELRRAGAASGAASTSGAAPISQKPEKPHFICECFFITARALHLGPLRILTEDEDINRSISHRYARIKLLQALDEEGRLGREEKKELDEQTRKAKRLLQMLFAHQVPLLDTELLQSMMSFYRLMSVWLGKLVGGLRFPLPLPAPVEFASMPEHFVEDMCKLLLHVFENMPRALEGQIWDEVLTFLVIFMGSPLYIRNPYLRSEMVKVLAHMLPSKLNSPSLQNVMLGLFEGHEVSIRAMVPNLLRLYVDSETTGSHNQFYDKFTIRHNIAEILQYLWQIPAHRNVWLAFAKEEEGTFYLEFLSMLVNDSIYQLDEALKKLMQARELENKMADTATWEAQPLATRIEEEENMGQMRGFVRNFMFTAGKQLDMMGYTTTEITATFLRPEMVERIATMLNYFLYQLVGPQRKELKVKNPEKYEFRPKELLAQIMDIYVNLARADKDDAFATAIGKDERSYREEAFAETAAVIQSSYMRTEGQIRSFLELGARVKRCKIEAMDVEAALGDIPDEFLDPIQCTLMKDPVLLPSSKTIIDRSTIMRHLLSDKTDPFNRSFLSVDMLQPATELRARIDAFLAEHRQDSK